MGGNLHFLFAEGTFAPSTPVSSMYWSILDLSGVGLVDLVTLQAYFLGVADGTFFLRAHQMMRVTIFSKETTIAKTAECGRVRKPTGTQLLFEGLEVGAVLSFAGATPFSFTRMMSQVFMIVPAVAIVAEVGSGQQSAKRVAAVVMIVQLDEENAFVRGVIAFVNDVIR